MGVWLRLVAVALVAVGLYQLSPLKTACLKSCRSPLGFFMTRRVHSPKSTPLAPSEGCCSGTPKLFRSDPLVEIAAQLNDRLWHRLNIGQSSPEIHYARA